MANMKIADSKDVVPSAPANVAPAADLTTIPGFVRSGKAAKEPAMVPLAVMAAEAVAIQARHPNLAFDLEHIAKRDVERGSLDRLDAAEDRRHKARLAQLALRRAVLEAVTEDDHNMHGIWSYYGEVEKRQNPQAVEKRNKEQAQARKQKENERWAAECAEYDRRKAKRTRAENRSAESEEPEYNAPHIQVRDLEEDDLS